MNVQKYLYMSQGICTCQRDLHMSKETKTFQTGRTHVIRRQKTLVLMSKETYTCPKGRTHFKRDLNVLKETKICQKDVKRHLY